MAPRAGVWKSPSGSRALGGSGRSRSWAFSRDLAWSYRADEAVGGAKRTWLKDRVGSSDSLSDPNRLDRVGLGVSIKMSTMRSARFGTAVATLWVGLTVGSAHAAGLPPITGARPAVSDEYESRNQLLVLERRLQEELVAAGDKDEILAFLSRGRSGDEGQIVVRIRAGLARLTFMLDPNCSYERAMSAEELDELRTFLQQRKAFDLGELRDAEGGMQNELLRLTKSGGRRVYMENPSPLRARTYYEIRRHFRSLLRKPGLALRCQGQQQIPDLEVLVADPEWKLVGVRMDGRQLILRVHREHSPVLDDFVVPDRYRLRGKLDAIGAREITWVTWPSASVVTQERLSALSLAPAPLPDKIFGFGALNRGGWASKHGGFRYVVGKVDGKEGLWRASANNQLDLVASGKMSTPLVSLDGRSIVVEKTDRASWGQSSYFAWINLKTKKVTRLDVPSANEMLPMLPTPDGFLLRRARLDPDDLDSDCESQGPEKPEYYLLDAGSGAVKKVEGSFEPLLHELKYPFQTTSSGQIWALSADWDNERSVIGRYDLRKFTFTPARELPGLAIEPNDFWVDEPTGKVYAIYMGDLVRFSLKKP
jgi:hypothetical protein